MPSKDINKLLVKLAGIDAKLDSVSDLLKRHDETFGLQESRLRSVEKHVNVAYGWAGAIGLVASFVTTWIWDKVSGK
jgi:predicted subunit of tRNA(5-methylaminomethyl-2-thiouridylate) methyltransferase